LNFVIVIAATSVRNIHTIYVYSIV